jgi:hypothetical protein
MPVAQQRGIGVSGEQDSPPPIEKSMTFRPAKCQTLPVFQIHPSPNPLPAGGEGTRNKLRSPSGSSSPALTGTVRTAPYKSCFGFP